MHSTWRVLVGGGTAFLVCAGLSAAAKPEAKAKAVRPAESDWMPLADGMELIYAISGQSTRTVGDREEPAQPVEAIETDRVERDGKRFRMSTRIVLRAEGKEAPPATRTIYLSADARGVYLLGHVLETPPAEDVKYEPALVLLKLPVRPGDRWKVGTYRSHDVRMTQAAEVLGFEDVETPAGTFRHCLKLRYTAPISGTLGGGAKPIQIDGGDVQYVEWFASGIGNVKQVSTYSQTFTLPDGRHGSSAESRTRILTSRGPAKP